MEGYCIPRGFIENDALPKNAEILMQSIRPAQARGQSEFPGLRSMHSFSFGHYLDRAHMGFGALRVINEDHLSPGSGFPMHVHKDMEILSFVRSGSLRHQDSLGHRSIIGPGEVQRMTAGTGISHSECNVSDLDAVAFLQVWIEPEKDGLEPSYQQKSFASATNDGLTLVASREGRDGSLTIHQQVDVYLGRLQTGSSIKHRLGHSRVGWLQMLSGAVASGSADLRQGDGMALADVEELTVDAVMDSEFLLFDMGRQGQHR